MNTETKLTSENVDRLMRECLFTDEECKDGKPPPDAIIVEGILNDFGFHPGRIQQHKEEIKEMLRQLPEPFSAGWSFLNACVTKDGEQWGEHRNMDQLFSLGQATKNVVCCMPRSMWKLMPGGMPYYQTKDL